MDWVNQTYVNEYSLIVIDKYAKNERYKYNDL